MKKSPPRLQVISPNAFTLIEMLMVIAIIATLMGLVLGISGAVRTKGNRARAESEIQALSAACESYRADNGAYPQAAANSPAGDTDTLDARKHGDPNADVYKSASLALYKLLTGDDQAKPGGPVTAGSKNYAPDFFKLTSRLGGPKTDGVVTSVQFIRDPFGNSYGYSTAGANQEQTYRTALLTNTNAQRPTPAAGYNSTFDLWSTAGDTTPTPTTDTVNKWLKNW